MALYLEQDEHIQKMNCCRTCLSKSELNKIFSKPNKNVKCSKVLLQATGLKVEMNDGLPQTMCSDCINFINQFLSFRKKCKKSYQHLVGQIRIKLELEDNVIQENGYIHVNSMINWDNETVVAAEDPLANIIIKTKDHTAIKLYDKSANKEISLKKIAHEKVIEKNVSELIENAQNSIEMDGNDDLGGFLNYDINNTVERNEAHCESKEFETTIEEILKKPTDIFFDNKKLSKNIQLEHKEVAKEKKDRLKREEVKKEMKDEPVECKYCHKIVKSKCALNNHYKIHTGRNIVCEHCGKKFTSKRRLLIHCRGKHGYKKTDKCKFCDYRGSSLEMVKIHERLHTGERPYVCACGAAFHRRSSLLQHAPTHRAEKTVPCDECPALFKSVTLMKIHKNRHKTRRKRQIAAAAELAGWPSSAGKNAA